MSRSNQHFVASLIHTIATHTSDVNSVAFSPDGTLATASGDKTVRLWDTADFSELTASPLVGHSYYVHCCTFSPFGTILATCSTDGKLILWDVKSGSKVCEHWHMINCTFVHAVNYNWDVEKSLCYGENYTEITKTCLKKYLMLLIFSYRLIWSF